MDLEAIWVYFVLMAVVMGVAALPVFRFLDDVPNADTRYRAIDGLRGFLALGVFVFHLVVTRRHIETGVWAPPESRFYALLGPVGVSVFFMLTGFLFWGKLLRAHGRPPWAALYVGRLFRIVPMYLVVVLAMLVVVFSRTGFELREPAAAVAWAVLQWLALGMIDTQPDINGYPATHVLAGVTWTLWYEWLFYGSLLAMASFARGRAHWMFVLVALGLCLAGKVLWHIDALGQAALFALGMAVASLQHEDRIPRMTDRVSSSLALLCLVLVFATSRGGYGTGTAALLAAFFTLVCSGSSLFGLLTTSAAQRLGRVSYSLYLMQGLVLTLVLGTAPVRSVAMASHLAYWAIGTGCACVLLAAAAIGYSSVEKPGIALGRRLILGRELRRGPRPNSTVASSSSAP